MENSARTNLLELAFRDLIRSNWKQVRRTWILAHIVHAKSECTRAATFQPKSVDWHVKVGRKIRQVTGPDIARGELSDGLVELISDLPKRFLPRSAVTGGGVDFNV